MNDILVPVAERVPGHPVHAALAYGNARDAPRAGRHLSGAEGEEGGRPFDADEAEKPLDLRFALNPFDHGDLLLAGVTDWSKTSDARIDGAAVRGALRLFLDGLRSGRLEMLLILGGRIVEADEPSIEGAKNGRLQDNGVGVHDAVACGEHDIVPGVLSVDAVPQVRLDHDPLLSSASLPQILGFAIVSIQGGWWNGLLLYLKPEHRGHGLARAYHEESFRLAGKAGLRGVQVISTLPRLGRESNLFKKELHLVQGDGTPVWRYWRESR